MDNDNDKNSPSDESEIEKQLDHIKESMPFFLFERSKRCAIAGKYCVLCGGPAVSFSDELSRKRYDIAGICDNCQQEVFTEEGSDYDTF